VDEIKVVHENLKFNVTLSHLRSKVNSRTYISHVYLTTGIHLNVHWCTLKCIPGKVVALQKSKPLSSKQPKP